MITVELARRLRDAGLTWRPTEGDRFVIPDRGLDDRVFTISEMTVDVRLAPAGPVIAFNGTVEWALDAILQREVVWLPSEAQLRDLLGESFVALERSDDRWCCRADIGGGHVTTESDGAADAYGEALLRRLEYITAS